MLQIIQGIKLGGIKTARVWFPKMKTEGMSAQLERSMNGLLQTADLALNDAVRDIGDLSINKKITDTFFKLNMLKVDDVFNYQTLKFIFKSLKHHTPSIFWDWFKLGYMNHNYRTRANFNSTSNTSIPNLLLPSARTTNYGLKQIRANGPRIWNSLPIDIKCLNCMYVFQNKVKSFLLSKYV